MALTDPEFIAAITPLAIALIGMALQYLKGKDTDKHGDAFITMLKGQQETMEKISAVLPTLKPYVLSYSNIVERAETIWNSGGMTAEDVEALRREASFWKAQIDAAIIKYRELKRIVAETPETQ